MRLARTMMTSSVVMLLDHLLKMVAIFLVTPWMARGLGAEQYGLWLLAMSLVGYLQLIDFGVTLAGSRYLARQIGAKNTDRLAQTVAALRRIYHQLGLWCLLAVLILISASAWFFRAESWRDDLLSIIVTLGLGTAVRLWCRLPAALLRGHLAYAALVWASIIRTVIQAVGAWWVLHVGADFKTLTLTYLAADLIELGFQNLAARRYQPLKSAISADYRQETAEILRYALQSLAGAVATSLRGQVPPVAVAWALGVAALPIYSIAMRLVGVVEDSLGALFGGQWLSAFSQMEGSADAETQRKEWIQRLVRFSAALGTAAIGGLLILGRPFLEIWLGAAFLESHSLLFILAFPIVINLAQWPARALIASSPYFPAFTRWSFIGGCGVALGSFITAHFWGIQGVMWLLAAHHLLLFGFLLTHYIGLITHLTMLNYWAPALRIIAILGAVTWIYGQVLSEWLIPKYLHLLAIGSGYAAVAVITIYLFGLNREERAKLNRTLFRLKQS